MRSYLFCALLTASLFVIACGPAAPVDHSPAGIQSPSDVNDSTRPIQTPTGLSEIEGQDSQARAELPKEPKLDTPQVPMPTGANSGLAPAPALAPTAAPTPALITEKPVPTSVNAAQLPDVTPVVPDPTTAPAHEVEAPEPTAEPSGDRPQQDEDKEEKECPEGYFLASGGGALPDLCIRRQPPRPTPKYPEMGWLSIPAQEGEAAVKENAANEDRVSEAEATEVPVPHVYISIEVASNSQGILDWLVEHGVPIWDEPNGDMIGDMYAEKPGVYVWYLGGAYGNYITAIVPGHLLRPLLKVEGVEGIIDGAIEFCFTCLRNPPPP